MGDPQIIDAASESERRGRLAVYAIVSLLGVLATGILFVTAPLESSFETVLDPARGRGYAHTFSADVRPDLGRWQVRTPDAQGYLMVLAPPGRPPPEHITLLAYYPSGVDIERSTRTSTQPHRVEFAGHREELMVPVAREKTTVGDGDLIVMTSDEFSDPTEPVLPIFFIVAGILCIWRGFKNLHELRGRGLLRPHNSEFYTMLKFGVMCVALELGLIIDAMFRRVDLGEDWSVHVVAVVCASAGLLVIRPLGRWIGFVI